MKYVLKINFLKTILIISSLIAIGLPLCVIIFIYPSFHGLLTKNTENEAVRIARHLASSFTENQDMLSRDSLTNEILSGMQRPINDFGLMKLKIFSNSGETIFSTTLKDIGVINKNRYFYDIVAKGKVYTKVVKKGNKSLEGQIVTADVVETYIPIIKNDKFVGAFEIYYDITDRTERLDKLLLVSSAVLILLAIGLQGAIIIVLVRAGNYITQREQAEEALSKSEERFRLLYERAPLAYQSLDKFGNFIEINQAWSEMLGYSKEEVVGTNAGDYLNPDYINLFKEYFPRFKAIGEVLGAEYEMVKKDGPTITVSVNGKIGYDEKGEFKQTHCILHNITEQKQAENALRESERKVRLLLDSTAEAIYGLDMDGNCTFVNPACLKLLGYKSTDELLGKNMHNLVHHTRPDGSPYPVEECRIHQAFIKGEGSHVDDEILWCADGTSFSAEYWSYPIFEDDRVIGSVVTFLDITERKRAEEALRDSEEKYSNLFHKSHDAIIIHDLEGKIIDVNNKVLEQFGWSKSEILALKLPDLHPSKKHEKSLWAFEKITKDGFVSFEVDFIKKTGELFTGEVSSSLFEIGTKKVIQGIIRDVTDRKKLEVQLQQAQKIESIGTLAGGIAHDFNNILSAVIGNAEMAQSDIPEQNPARYSIDQIIQAGYRARDLVKQILAFSRQTEQELKPIKVSFIVKEALKLLRPSLPSTIQIIQQIIAKKDTIIADPTHIHQVLMNLCTNAMHSMFPEGGSLEVSLNDVDLDSETALSYQDLEPGSYIKLRVSDTGHGMEREVTERIFDPYFTTKEKGEGTGLGLSVVNGIVKNHGGAITVYSEPGKGTTFNILFPSLESDVELRSVAFKPDLKGNERIMFVDDEEILVNLGKRMLQQLGYKVATRTSSIEALEAFRSQPERYDLIITDLTMPNMTGDKLAKELLRIRSDIPIILCTGFSEIITESKAKGIGIKAFIMKPIVRAEIAETIREVLDQ